jgi:aerobic carbon-monoxide dehydrogenase medium subunit
MFRLLQPFEYHEAASVQEAVELLARYGDRARVVAGGTDLVISMKKRELAPEHVIALGGIPGLDRMEFDSATGMRLGPLVTHATIARSPLVRQYWPLLATASNEVGTPAIRTMGTIGGNVCKSGPSQDTPPVLVALEAQLQLIGPHGERVVPMEGFCIGPFCTILAPDELITQIRVPLLPPDGAGCYKWVTKVTATDETLAGVAAVLVVDGDGVCRDVRIGMGSVAPKAMRARDAEEVLRGQPVSAALIEEVARKASGECLPRSRADYRRHMVRVLTRDALLELWTQLGGPGSAGDPGGDANRGRRPAPGCSCCPDARPTTGGEVAA